MWRLGLLGLGFLTLLPAAGNAQWGSSYNRGYSYYRPAPQYGFFSWWDNDDDEFYRPRSRGPSQQSGGARPAIAPQAPASINFPNSYPVGSVVIDTRGRRLFLVQSPTTALHYPISVGREGFTWTGTEKISRKAEWPDWYPPEEMRDRDWRLPEKMTGGIKNPLGAMALYLGNSALSHPRHQRRQVHRPGGLIGMLPHAQCPHRRSCQSCGHVVRRSTVVHRLPPELERVVAQQGR